MPPAVEKSYLNWLRKIEERQAREAAKAAKWASKHAALLDSLKHLLPDSWNGFHSVNRVKK